MEKEKALAIWDAIFGKNEKWQTDCFGTWMYRDDYGDTKVERIRPDGDGKKHIYGWEIDHIRPKSDFKDESDADFMNNYEPMQWCNNRDKSDDYPQFVIHGLQYQVVKCDICGSNGLKGYGIVNNEGERIDWKGKADKCFKNN